MSRRSARGQGIFDWPRTSNGPTTTINVQLEHFRGSVPGFQNLAHSIAR